ncbi:4Fe-4S dicluster domain-containing protein [Desulfovibrio aminophilus]|uniref:4Fe-4S dicluster domain-containing protein n=1 Tax=Desulfovibrio aminophilus TaxID=81425 RepID=UPI0033943905
MTTTAGKSFFIDQTRCTACRACQVACKQWKQLPAVETANTGSYQNPPDLDGDTLKIVRFHEVEDANGIFRWLFFPEQCRHCVDPPCKMQADMYDRSAIRQDDVTGAVVYTEATRKLDYEEIRTACPYDIPRKNERSGVLVKCDMCSDRVAEGLLPACVKTCPTGTMHFGDRAEMLTLAEKRLAEVRRTQPQAILADAADVRVIYLCEMDPALYHKFMVAGAKLPARMTRQELLAGLLRPFKAL